jgi:hypothetical protein
MSLPGRLAQLVEHLHDAQEVRRSSRLPPTRSSWVEKRHLAIDPAGNGDTRSGSGAESI